MIFAQCPVKRLDIQGPGEWTSLPQIVRMDIIIEGFDLKRVIPIRDVVALTIQSAHQIENSITDPMKNKQHLHLLPEMYFFMADQLSLIVRLAGDPDKNEK